MPRTLREKLLITLSLYLAVLFFVVWVKTSVVNTGFRLRELQLKRQFLHQDLSELEFRWGRITSLAGLAGRSPTAKEFLMPGEYPLEKIRYLPK